VLFSGFCQQDFFLPRKRLPMTVSRRSLPFSFPSGNRIAVFLRCDLLLAAVMPKSISFSPASGGTFFFGGLAFSPPACKPSNHSRFRAHSCQHSPWSAPVASLVPRDSSPKMGRPLSTANFFFLFSPASENRSFFF